MGLFGKGKKQKENAGRVLPSFVLLEDVAFDMDLFLKDVYEDWGIQIPADQTEERDGLPSFVAMVDNTHVAVSLMPAPIPNGEAVENAKTNFRWPEAVSVAERHGAHVLVIVLPLGGQPLKETASLHAKICASCLKQPNAIGINTAGSVLAPDFYMDSARLYIQGGKFPILNHVFFGVYSKDEGKTFSGYTYGLDGLGKQDFEVLDSSHSPDEVFAFLTDVALYLLEYNVTLKHGETIGFSAEQKLGITESKGVAVGGKTLKIAF